MLATYLLLVSLMKSLSWLVQELPVVFWTAGDGKLVNRPPENVWQRFIAGQR